MRHWELVATLWGLWFWSVSWQTSFPFCAEHEGDWASTSAGGIYAVNDPNRIPDKIIHDIRTTAIRVTSAIMAEIPGLLAAFFPLIRTSESHQGCDKPILAKSVVIDEWGLPICQTEGFHKV